MFITKSEMIQLTIYGLSKDNMISFFNKLLNDQHAICWNIIHVYKLHFNQMNWKSNCQVEIEKNEYYETIKNANIWCQKKIWKSSKKKS
jgi:hypothetical protein